jgi:hypothetical protein
MATVILMLIVAAEESDDGHGTFMARSADGVPRKPVHGRHEAADAAIHASSLTTASSPLPSPFGSAMMLRTSCLPLLLCCARV